MTLYKSLLILSILTWPAHLAMGQDVVFQHAYGGSGQETCSDIEVIQGGYILGGHSSTWGAGSYDFALVKTNISGYILWSKTYGATGQDLAISLTTTLDNGFALTGYTKSFIGTSELMVVKTDSSGNLEWANRYEEGWGYDISQTPDKGFIVTGYFDFDLAAKRLDMCLLKLDSMGNTEWSWVYGDSLIEMGRRVLQTSDGGYLVSGYAKNSLGGQEVPLMIKTDNMGVPIWAKKYVPTVLTSYGYYGYAVAEIEGGYVASSIGYTDSYNSGNSADIQVFRIDSLGNVIWSKAFGGTGYDDARDMYVNDDNEIVIAGSTNNWTNGQTDFLIMKIDGDGNLIWSNSFGGTVYDEAQCMAKDSGDSYVIAGLTLTYGFGENDMYMAKVSAKGKGGCSDNTFTINTADFPIAPEDVTNFTQLSITATDVSSLITVTSPTFLHEVVCETIISVGELSYQDGLDVYPNPSTGRFTIDIDSWTAEQIDLTIVNILGEEVYSTYLPPVHGIYKRSIDLGHCSRGIYFLSLSSEFGVQTRRMVIQ